LRLIKDHLALSASIEKRHFDDDDDFAARGGLQKVWAVFGGELEGLMDELNLAMVA
jgi:type I restriction enzyme, R subunit